VDQLLIAGIDSVVGANLAAHLADRFRVVGTSTTSDVSIEGCETIVTAAEDAQAIRQLASRQRPGRIVLCQAAGDTAWHRLGGWVASPSGIESARLWAEAAGELGIPVTLLSSDAVFTGPWMFHGETSDSYCPSMQARSLRTLESSVLDLAPQTLVVRTHAYGWSPGAGGSGWIEGIVAALESDEPGVFDCAPHATPILATDLAEILGLCWEAGLSGMYHIAGAERVNPHRFVSALARVFDLAAPRGAVLTPGDSAGTTFGQSETSLRTRTVQRTVGRPMPMLVEGLQRLLEQKNGGFDRRFRGGRRLVPSKVA
jgi:dTDP-4-dehydrorhamnose reductase